MAAALLTAVSLTLAGCGQDEQATPSSDTAAEATTTEGAEVTASSASAGEDAGSTSSFPSVPVVDLASGESVDLGQTLAGGDTPVLFWFWSPF